MAAWFSTQQIIMIMIIITLSNHHAVHCSNTVEALPGFHGSLPFKLQTGYISVDESEGVEYFYYFVESEGNAKEDPLVAWFTGGPGCSALCGLAFEIGPIRFNMFEYNGSLPTFVLNPYSWTKVSSTIFIDGPVGTGFSYSKSLEGSQSNDFLYANRSFNFMRKWLLKHPGFISNPLFVAGDSFSGIVVPIIAEEIVKSIEAGNVHKLNFKGYLLGNPATDEKFDENSKIPFAHRNGLISDELYKSMKKNCKGEYRGSHEDNEPCAKDLQDYLLCTERVAKGYTLEPKCVSNSVTSNRKPLLSVLDPPPPPEETRFGCRNYENFLIYIWANDKEVQKALHVRNGTLTTWIRCNRNLPYTRLVQSVIGYHQRLNSRRRYRALIYSGDHDMKIPYIGTQGWIKSMKLPIVSKWRPWFVDDQVGGYATEYANGFTFSTVKGGGHTAPEYKDKESFAMFQRWISNSPL